MAFLTDFFRRWQARVTCRNCDTLIDASEAIHTYLGYACRSQGACRQRKVQHS